MNGQIDEAERGLMEEYKEKEKECQKENIPREESKPNIITLLQSNKDGNSNLKEG